MSEESNLLAEDNENEAALFFEKICKWDTICDNFDIKEAEHSRKKYGIDRVFKCFDPFLDSFMNIMVECKYRQDNKNVTRTTLWDMVKLLRDKTEIARNSPSWSETAFSDKLSTGEFKFGCVFLKIKEYNHEKFMKDLGSIQLQETEKENPPIITTLTNYRISKIVEFVQNKKNLQFYYPVYGKNLTARDAPYLSFSYLFSDIIIGKYLKTIRVGQTEKEEEIYFILSFEKPSVESVNYLRNAALLWNLYPKVKEIYFTEGNNANIQEYNSYKTNGDTFDIKIIQGDISLNYKMEDKISVTS